jgi:hypothetical protein
LWVLRRWSLNAVGGQELGGSEQGTAKVTRVSETNGIPPTNAASTLCAKQQAGINKKSKIKTAKWLTRIIFLTQNASVKNDSAFVSKNDGLVQTKAMSGEGGLRSLHQSRQSPDACHPRACDFLRFLLRSGGSPIVTYALVLTMLYTACHPERSALITLRAAEM